MKVAANTVVTLDFELHNEQGDLIESTEGFDPMVALIGHGDLAPGMDEALMGLSAGDSFEVTLPPEKAYGHRQTHLTQVVDIALFGGVEVEVGMQFQAQAEHGVDIVTVVGVQEDKVAIDGNHPLAGETLVFKGTVREVREADAEEIAHGHVHHGGHHHHH